MTLVTTFTLVAGAAGSASADSRGINFEPSQGYSPGSIDGQQGWHGQNQPPPGIPINPAIDQKIVTNSGAPGSFGIQSWRISNAFTTGSFGDMPFSPSLVNEAGETQALNGNGVVTFSGGTRQNQFETQWSFTSADPTGSGTACPDPAMATVGTCSYLSMAPDRGDGARMSYIRLEDDTSGLRVFFDDYQDVYPYGTLAVPANGCSGSDDFTETMVASGLNRATAHTVKLTIGFLDGPRNDVVNVYVDGIRRLTGTTWEDYFRWCTESGGGVPNDSVHDQSRTVDSMIFTVRGGIPHPSSMTKGFLIDNLFYASSTSRHDCGNHRGHGEGNNKDKKFKFNKECNNDDRDMAEHDDEGNGHHFQSSSVDNAQYDSVGGAWQMTMVGSGTDNGEPVTFTIIAVNANGLLPATYSIVLSNGYSWAGNVEGGSIDIE